VTPKLTYATYLLIIPVLRLWFFSPCSSCIYLKLAESICHVVLGYFFRVRIQLTAMSSFFAMLTSAVPLERWHRKSACSGQVVRRFDDTWRISKWVNVTARKSCRIITIEYSRLINLAVHFVILVLHFIAALLLLLLWFSRTCHVLQAISVGAGPHPRPDRCRGCQVPDKMAE
jgi:hypothetical protein